MATVLKVEQRITKKLRRCGECGVSIAPGTHYVMTRGFWEGGWATSTCCVLCRDVWLLVWPWFHANEFDCVEFGELWYMIKQYMTLSDVKSTSYSGEASPEAYGTLVGKLYTVAMEMDK